MTLTAETTRSFPAPRTLEQSGLPWDVAFQLVLKMLHLSGEISGEELGSRLGVRFSVIEPCIDVLKLEHLCEIGRGSLGPPSYRYRLTDAGRTRAATYLEQSQYVGPLPVPLSKYTLSLRDLGKNSRISATRTAVREAYSHLVLSDRVLDQLGPAIAAFHSLFIYGPAGNGKTVMAQAIRNLLVGDIAIPHAISVDTHVIRVYDPNSHEAISEYVDSDKMFQREDDSDHRWVRCRRPLITVGGELTMDALNLSSDSGVYRAPLQVVANGGVLVIDDFGRQQASPRALLNRWVVPLESRVDYLTLKTGQKIQIPFEVLIVFATNLDPRELVDDAFLRRIHYKVYAEAPTVQEFIEIFEDCCQERGLRFDRSLVESLIKTELQPRKVALRGCQPRDLIDHALTLAAYAEQPRELTSDLLASACAMYFVGDPTTTPPQQ